MAVGLAASSPGLVAGRQPLPTCERTIHACAKVVIISCCCQPSDAAATVSPVFLEAWTLLTKVQWATTARVPGSDAQLTLTSAFAPIHPSVRARPPRSPGADVLTALLI
jgi:hypothetical protein